jgi:signal transduction histidine kinase
MNAPGETRIQDDACGGSSTRDTKDLPPEALQAELERIRRELRNLKQAEQLRSALTRAIYHDLKAPINTIMSCIDVVFEGTLGSISSRQKEFLKKAENGLYRLSSFVDRLLELGRIEGNLFNQKPDDLLIGEVLIPLVENARVKAVEKGISLKLEIEEGLPSIHTDKASLEHIFQNLLSNAVKYTLEGGEVRVIARREGSRLAVSVKDNGVGIAEEDIPDLFTPFHRCRRAAELDRKGTGLGLSVARMIVDACGGDIEVESAPGIGSTFKFSYPFESL